MELLLPLPHTSPSASRWFTGDSEEAALTAAHRTYRAEAFAAVLGYGGCSREHSVRSGLVVVGVSRDWAGRRRRLPLSYEHAYTGTELAAAMDELGGNWDRVEYTMARLAAPYEAQRAA